MCCSWLPRGHIQLLSQTGQEMQGKRVEGLVVSRCRWSPPDEPKAISKGVRKWGMQGLGMSWYRSSAAVLGSTAVASQGKARGAGASPLCLLHSLRLSPAPSPRPSVRTSWPLSPPRLPRCRPCPSRLPSPPAYPPHRPLPFPSPAPTPSPSVCPAAPAVLP